MKYPLGSPQAMKLEKSLVDPAYFDPPAWEETCYRCGKVFELDKLNEDELCEKCAFEPKYSEDE